MVASGFLPETTAVSPYRLVVHLVLALVLYAALLWTGLTVLRPVAATPGGEPAAASPGRGSGCAVSQLTMLAGGFVAGTHAGLDYNTFPLMEGGWCQRATLALKPFVAQSNREHCRRCSSIIGCWRALPSLRLP